ncbi:cysteine-rich CWC family protein [Roseateles violae]|uniref:Cysteine-rich CWC family protein n=1 Tax=Roseateles violae TaxID=3058042 RepID=A0ABT8DYD8_9BURK|nr:cysteine-rich CWC family protein [Pelomonas sp. PFR6]MDN3922499.1 cysteine-rich CWC family protein [Pelomonas sp. PFR6]
MSEPAAAARPDNARCPRCGGAFHCGAGEVSCPCFELRLGEALREQLARQYGGSDCLCIACLALLQRQALHQQSG